MIKLRARKIMNTPEGLGELDVDLTIDKGEFVTFFGESGVGKTTLLRILAGLTRPDSGYIEFDGQVWFDNAKNFSLPVGQRRVGFVFQEHSLFPHMSVRQNLLFALADKTKVSMIDGWLELLGLQGLREQKPARLSGGQKQRVALARTLVNGPKVLLLDEPLSSLDIESRLKLQDEIVSIYQKTGITTILVSHDLAEVFKLSGKIFVIEKGKIVKSGPPQKVFVNDNLSGKFKFTGEIVEVQKDGVVNILTVRIGNNMTKVVATDEEIKGLRVGSKVIVATKAFNPIIISPNAGQH